MPEYQLSADIHSHKAGTKYPSKLPLHLAGLISPQLLLVMRSRGEPQSITVKVVTALMLKNAKIEPKIA